MLLPYSISRLRYVLPSVDERADEKAEGDLSFSAGDRIELVERTENADDWWTGKLNGRTGVFPGTYTQVDGE